MQICGSSLTTKNKQNLQLLLQIYLGEDCVFSNGNIDDEVESSDISTSFSDIEKKYESIEKRSDNSLDNNLWKNNSGNSFPWFILRVYLSRESKLAQNSHIVKRAN